jgi:hypothetical protein
MPQEVLAVGSLVGASVEMHDRRLEQLQCWFTDSLCGRKQLPAGQPLGPEALMA